MPEAHSLVVNTGSSSLKLGVYALRHGEEELLLDAMADGVGKGDSQLTLKDSHGKVLRSGKFVFRTQQEAMHEARQWFAEFDKGQPSAIGHRVVHGGPRLTTHQRITPDVMSELRQSIDFAPLHLPMAIALIEDAQQAYPDVPQFACFDTAFHRTLPEAAARFALPRALYEQGIRRYGFHGLSYESLVYQLGPELRARTVMAHLGGGASLAAISHGQSVATSMGLTPTGGIPMATRSGDVDPGVLLYLLRTQNATADSLQTLLNEDSGMKAISAGKSDMRDLEAAAKGGDQQAQLAITMFCNAIAQTVAAYAAVLGGLEMLVFAGGIGEHSALVRREVCHRLGFLGVVFDDAQNDAPNDAQQEADARTISTPASAVVVRVLPAEEDQQIARHCRALMK
jgi:acetate kinase